MIPRHTSPFFHLTWVLALPALISMGTSPGADWVLVEEPEKASSPDYPGLSYTKRVLRRSSDGKLATVQLSFFNSVDFRLEVIDLGGDDAPRYPSLRDALQHNQCPAGVNGGFFYPGFQPMGLVIAQGQRQNRWENVKLLSGVIYGDHLGIHLIRRAAFVDHPQITALLQSGPFLIEHGLPVRGLSPEDPRRRTFIATDWRRNWALATCSALSLAELAELLHDSPRLTGWPIDRALNLDGGSSSAFFFDQPGQTPDISVANWKRIRNVLAVAPKR